MPLVPLCRRRGDVEDTVRRPHVVHLGTEAADRGDDVSYHHDDALVFGDDAVICC